MTDLNKLADELEAWGATSERLVVATVKRRVAADVGEHCLANLPAILSALRSAGKMREALESIGEYWNEDANHDAMLNACEYARDSARSALKTEGE